MGIATSFVAVICVIIGLVVGVGIGYWIAPAEEVEEEVPLKVGVVLYGHHDVGLWDPCCARGITDLIDMGYDIDVRYSEEVSLTDLVDIVEMRASADDLVYLSTDVWEEAAHTVAPNHPDVAFAIYWYDEIAPDYFPPNVVACRVEPACMGVQFLAGVISGKMTETNKIGIVQAIPGPRDTAIMNAFKQGVHYVDPDIEVSRTIIGAYSDPIKARDAAASFAEAGCDVVFNGLDDEAVVEEAQSRGIYAIASYSDFRSEYPNTIVANTTWDFSAWLKDVVDAVLEDRFAEYAAEHRQDDITLEKWTTLCGYMVPENVQDYVEEVRGKILTGEIEIQTITEW